MKAHMLIRAKDNVPCFVHITEAKASGRAFMPSLILPPGSIMVKYKIFLNHGRASPPLDPCLPPLPYRVPTSFRCIGNRNPAHAE